MIRQALLLIALPLWACTSWAPLSADRPAPRATPVQVWSAEGVVVVRHLIVTADSVAGHLVWPDSGRVALPRAAVDSLRIQTADAGKIAIVGVAAGIGLLYAGVPWRLF